MGQSLEIIVFSCNWDGLSCVEAAARARLTYPALVKIIRIGCLSRVHGGLILKAFELGAGGVMLLGCETGKCHYDIESGHTRREIGKAQGILRLLGLGPERLMYSPLSRADGPGFIERLNTFFVTVRALPR